MAPPRPGGSPAAAADYWTLPAPAAELDAVKEGYLEKWTDQVGLGRIAALFCRSPASYPIREENRCRLF